MITFKPTEDLANLLANPTVRELIDRFIAEFTQSGQPCNWKDYSYVLLIDEPDADLTLDEILDGCRLLDI